MHLATLGAFIVLELVLCLIPGPAVMSVVSAALSRRERGFATATGILTGNSIYFVVSALGLASVLVASHRAFLVLKWCGAVYLAYLGVRALVARPTDLERVTIAPSGEAIARGWLNGTIVQLSNPKALVFFAAILPQFINPAGNVALQIAILGVAGLLVEFAVLSMYITGIDRIRQRGFSARSGIWAQRIGGALLIGVAFAVVRESA